MEFFAQQLVLGFAKGSVYALIAIGYTMVYGVLRLINFAHGDILMVGAYIAYFVIVRFQVPIEVAMLTAMVLCAGLGVLIERIAYRPLRRHPRLTMLITAVGVSLFLEYGGQLVFSPTPRPFPVDRVHGPTTTMFNFVSDRLSAMLNITLPRHALLIMVMAIGLMVALQVLVMRSKVGKAMRAVSYDRQTAALMGINIDRIIVLTFLIGSALGAAAGVMLAMYEPQINPIMGLMPGLRAFVAAVLGGIGNIPGAMLGGMIMGLAENMVTAYLSSAWRDGVAFLLLILILLLKPTGLTGRGAVEKV